MKHYCRLDLSTKSTSICVLNSDGEKVLEKEVVTDEREIVNALNGFKELMCVVESAPYAEWMCSVVEEAGHKIEIIDARHAQALMKQGKKTDRIDAEVLSQICRTGWYTKVHRKSGKARNFRSYLTARKQLVESQNSIGASIRGILRAHGIRVAIGGDFENNVKSVLMKVDPIVREAIRTMLVSWKDLYMRQRAMYRKLKKLSRKTEEVKLLMTIPGVGPATATAFVATIDDPKRFSSAEKVASYIGLVPKVYQSGETEYHGRITKHGDTLLTCIIHE